MSKPGENEIVQMLHRRFGAKDHALLRAIGEDAAIIRPGKNQEYWLLTTDILLEGVHFNRAWLTPSQLGHKALAANLSDIAAMGGRPRFYVVSLALPKGLKKAWLVSLYRGMSRLANRFNTGLIGGDLSRSLGAITISIAVLGQSNRRRVISRSGGRPGDLLYVTGVLGKSAAGLELLRRDRGRGRTRTERAALKAHREPQPRCAVGQWLARNGYPRAMMDLSDGLSTDLPRMCTESQTGAEVLASRLPMYAPSSAWDCDPLRLALHGGEDYELLFAVPPQKASALEKAYPSTFPKLARIGRLTESRTVSLLSAPDAPPRPLPALGFDHFR